MNALSDLLSPVHAFPDPAGPEMQTAPKDPRASSISFSASLFLYPSGIDGMMMPSDAADLLFS